MYMFCLNVCLCNHMHPQCLRWSEEGAGYPGLKSLWAAMWVLGAESSVRAACVLCGWAISQFLFFQRQGFTVCMWTGNMQQRFALCVLPLWGAMLSGILNKVQSHDISRSCSLLCSIWCDFTQGLIYFLMSLQDELRPEVKAVSFETMEWFKQRLKLCPGILGKDLL